MKKAGVIQVRMDSSRFPNKANQLIMGKPLLWHVIERSKLINIPIIVATTNRKIDDPIEKIAETCNVDIFRGSFENVLDRYYQTAKTFQLELIFRITADTPLIDPRLCSKLVHLFDSADVDYARFGYNTIGIGMEGFTFNTLKIAWENTTEPEDCEHVTKYMKEHPEQFKQKVFETSYDLGIHHWTVETPYDLEFVNKIFSEFGNNMFYTEDILKLFLKKPYLKKTQ